MEGDLEAVGLVPGGLRVGHRGVRVHVRRRADALPVGDGAAGGAVDFSRSKYAGGAPVAWSSPVRTIAAFSPRGRYQKRGSGALSRFISRDQVRQQALLLVGLRHVELARVDPVGLDVAGLGAVEEIVRADASGVPSRLSPAHAGLPWRV